MGSFQSLRLGVVGGPLSSYRWSRLSGPRHVIGLWPPFAAFISKNGGLEELRIWEEDAVG